MQGCAQYQKGSSGVKSKPFGFVIIFTTCTILSHIRHSCVRIHLLNWSQFLSLFKTVTNLRSLCKIRHSPPVGLSLRFIARFIERTPEESVRSSAKSGTLSKPAFRSPHKTPLLLQVPFHSSAWLVLSSFLSCLSHKPVLYFGRWHQATYYTRGLPIIGV